jgi:RNA polymerase sigma factor (sigma-70 family)
MNRPTDELDARIDMERLLAALPPQQRRAVRLYARGYTQQEVADALGVNQSTISRWLEQFRTSFRDFA